MLKYCIKAGPGTVTGESGGRYGFKQKNCIDRPYLG
jgi:hypothetical protein